MQLVAQKCCVASWDCLLHVLPPSHATNFHVAESRCRFYFLQHKNLLREKVVIRATNNLNLQRNISARQVARKCCPYYCTFNRERIVVLESKFHFQIEDCNLPTVDSFEVRNVDRVVYTYINQKFTREILACVAGVNGERKESESARENVGL